MRSKAYAGFLFLLGILFAGAGGDLLLTLERPEVIKNIGNHNYNICLGNFLPTFWS